MARRRAARKGPRGGSRLGALLFILILGVGIYLLTVYVPPYWAYLSLQDEVRVAVDVAANQRNEEKALANILAAARAQGLELNEDNVDIFVRDTHLVIRVAWTVAIEIPRYHHTLRFSIEKSTPLP